LNAHLSPCSLGLSATSQQYFSLRANQPQATSRNQPAVLFSQNKPAPAISHQPTEQGVCFLMVTFILLRFSHFFIIHKKKYCLSSLVVIFAFLLVKICILVGQSFQIILQH
jgi:hypothetical protein